MSALSDFIQSNGEWTAMAIKLGDGSYTRDAAVDYRLRRLAQVAQDSIGKPLAECRVLDLACLEGHYAVELALHGAEAIGIEGRAASVAKCNYAKEHLGLSRAIFYQDDVRNLSRAKYGAFDIVICSGILYHLEAADAVAFLKAIHEVCDGILLLDTFISLRERATEHVGDRTLHGHPYFEHSDADDEAKRKQQLWSSLDNNTSFWMTEATLANVLMDCGFTSVLDVLTPHMPGNARDRKTYLAFKGATVKILSSDPTASAPPGDIEEGINPRFHASQVKRGALFKTAKALLPPSIKDVIKPALRLVGVLHEDLTPEFLRKKR